MSPAVSRTSLLTSQASGRADARRCLLRYWPGICEFLAGPVQRPWHQLSLQSPLTLMMAKAGKFAVWFGCHNGQQCWYLWRAPVAGPPPQTVIGPVAFAFWFLSPSVELVQAFRERACGLGARLNHGGERPLTRRSTGRQKRTAFGSLRYRSGAGYLSVKSTQFGGETWLKSSHFRGQRTL